MNLLILYDFFKKNSDFIKGKLSWYPSFLSMIMDQAL